MKQRGKGRRRPVRVVLYSAEWVPYFPPLAGWRRTAGRIVSGTVVLSACGMPPDGTFVLFSDDTDGEPVYGVARAAPL